MYAELWESGRAGMPDAGAQACERWLVSLYQAPAPRPAILDSWLHDAGLDEPPAGRQSLSWWMLLEMLPEPPSGEPWHGETVLLPVQGLAIIRGPGRRYVSMEAGPNGGGHGHPDRLHLSVHDGSRHLLPDFGTGDYVSRDLFWYRSTLAHNAPRLDGVSQEIEPAACEMFDQQGPWSWVRARFGACTRTLVNGPGYLVDVTDLSGTDEHEMELPWHLMPEWSVASPGTWEPGGLEGEFVRDAQTFLPEVSGPVIIRSADPDVTCSLHLLGGILVRATAPAEPGGPERPFWVIRGRGRYLRFVTAVDLSPDDPVQQFRVEGDAFEVHRAGGVDLHSLMGDGWGITRGNESWKLAGPVPASGPVKPILGGSPVPLIMTGVAHWIDDTPPLDGSMTGFDTESPLLLDTEDQYRRSEEPWPGDEVLSGTAWANWNEDGLFLAVEVQKDDVWFRPGDAAPLDQDNESDDIHSDGLQLYLKAGERRAAWVVVPDPDDTSLRVRATASDDGSFAVRGSWSHTAEGYRVTLGIFPAADLLDNLDEIGFDLLINEMQPGRIRRAGQLVWSGGGGWVYLRGDRQPLEQLGVLELS
ncbi:MAG: heparinase II/III domain-containing protein, partial [Gemmatimonadales bacterium]